MAEVSGCLRSGAHRLSVAITLRRRYHHEFTSPAGSAGTHGVTNQPPTRGYGTGPREEHRSPTAYYDILRVSPSATPAQIKSAYYKQSFIHHPDRNRNRSEDAARHFALVAEAYSVLGDGGLRRKYDRGILNRSDAQSAGRPSTPRRAPDASPHFDCDAFYQAHYGEQLQREQQRRRRREQTRQQQQTQLRAWRRMKMNEVTVALLLLCGGGILISLRA